MAGTATDAQGSIIGEGASAVCRLDADGTVLKVYRGELGAFLQDREFLFAGIAHAGEIPTPKPLEKLDVDGAPAIRFEHFDGNNLDAWTLPRFWTWRRSATRLAEMHARIHVLTADPGFEIEQPSQDQLYRHLIEGAEALDDAQRVRCLLPLEDPSRRRRLCHGDLSPANVLVRGSEQVVIDWSLASAGDPTFDVAFTWVGIHALPQVLDLPPLTRRLLHYASEVYLRTYLDIAERAPSREDIEALLPTAAAARLGALERADGPAELRSALLGLIERWCAEPPPDGS